MTMQDMLNTIEANAGQGAQSTNDLFQYHASIEARASKTVETDIANIHATLTCLKGMCSLDWRPTKR